MKKERQTKKLVKDKKKMEDGIYNLKGNDVVDPLKA